MKRLISILAALLMFAQATAQATTVNYYVISEQARPFQIEEQGQNHSGIITDIVEEIFAGSDHSIEFHTFPFNRMITTLESGGESNWLTYGSPNWGRVQSENLSKEPVYTVKHVLVSSGTQPVQFSKMQDIEGASVVLLRGFDYPSLTPFFKDGLVHEMRVKDYQAAYRVIERTPGETVFVEMESRVIYNINQLGLAKSKFAITSFSSVIPDYSIYLALSPDMDEELQKYINQRLAQLKAEGKIADIINKYI